MTQPFLRAIGGMLVAGDFPVPVVPVLGIEPIALPILDKYSTTELHT